VFGHHRQRQLLVVVGEDLEAVVAAEAQAVELDPTAQAHALIAAKRPEAVAQKATASAARSSRS